MVLRMSTEPTKLTGDASSLVDLKAELFRKAQEAKFNARHGKKFIVKNKSKTEVIWSKQNIGIQKRQEREDRDAREAEKDVKEALERKAKLYSEMKEGHHSEHRDKFLVQFKDDDQGGDSDFDDDWVEYKDALGRSRMARKEDLAELQKTDHDLVQHREKQQQQQGQDPDPDGPSMLSEDMRRELLRQKWEKEEQENLEKRSVHYQDLRFDEARTHGAGFYQFSRDEGQRAEQKDALDQRHQETELAREEAKKTKKKRKKELQKRLKRVRERKRLKMGLPLKDEDSEDGESGEEEEPEPQPEKDLEHSILDGIKAMREEAEREARRKRTIREWDVGKEGITEEMFKMKGEKKVLSQGEWVQEKRQDRPTEFAPPTLYEPPAKKEKKRYNQPSAGGGSKDYQKAPPPSFSPAPSTSYATRSPVPSCSKYSAPPPELPPGCDITQPPPCQSANPMESLAQTHEETQEELPIGPSPRPRKVSENEEDLQPPGTESETLSRMSRQERLQVHSEIKSGVGSMIVNEVDQEFLPEEDYEEEEEEEDRESKKRAEIAPPCDMNYYNNMKGKSEKYRSGFRTHEAMASAFNFGLGQSTKKTSSKADESSDSD